MKKLLFLLFALVVSIGNAWADKTIYLNPGVWDTADQEAYAVWAWSTNNDGEWIAMTASEGICYKAIIPDGKTNIILTRRNASVGIADIATDWGNIWNQTNDISLSSVSDNTLFTITGWGSGDYNKTAMNFALLGTAIATIGNANLAIDGNTGTRWEGGASDPQTWQVDLGTETTFNTISILWETAYAKTFTIEIGNEVDTDGYLTGGTEIFSITDQSLEGFPYKQTLRFDDAQTARYIKFNGIARGTQWGYSFWEFEVQNIGSQTLGSLSLAVPNAARQDATLSACKVGESISISAIALDTENVDYSTEGITFTATNGTITDAGVFTPSAAGLCTITATLEGEEATATIYAYTGDDLLLNKAATANDGATDTNLFTDGNWGNRGGLGAAVPAWAQYDLEAYYTIDFVMLKQEQANSKNYKIQFSNDGDTWVDAYERTNVAGMQGDVWDYFYGNTTQNTDVRFIRFYSTEAATQYGVSIYEIAAYGTKTGEVADNVAPVLNTATVNATALGVSFTLKATDETASVISYTITDGTNVYNTSGANGTEITYTVYGMTAATHSNVIVVANDGHNDSETTTLTDFVVPAIPAIPAITETETYLLWDGNDGGAKNGMGFNDWGGGGNGANITINENAAYQISNFRWYGSQFTELDATPYDFLELDIFPSVETTTLAIVPINTKVEGTGNQNEKGQQFSVTPGEWNKLKINIADFIAENLTTMTKLFQIKFVSKVVNKGDNGATDGFANGNGTECFIVGNIYAYKNATKTVTFVNSGNWTTPLYAYAWYKDGTNNVVVSDPWPGDAMTDNGDGTFSWTTTGDPTKIIFNNGSTQTADLDFVDGATYTPAGCQYSVSFKNSIGWENVYAYTFGPQTLGAWPGTQMTKDGDVWTISFEGTTTPTNIIFNNGNTGTDNQTEDLEFVNGKEYDKAASMVITVTDGVATVTGIITSANVSAINNADAMFIDLAGVTSIEENVVITPKHANALIRVSGTAADPATMDEIYNNVTITGNKVVRRNDGYIFPVEKIQFVDDPVNEPMWNGEGQPANQKFISAGNTGFKVTRTLKAKAIGTIYLPGNSITLPDGVTAWEATAYSAADGITFTKAGVAAVFFPYVVINANDEDVDIYSEGVGDFNLIAWGTGNVAPHKIGTSDAYAQGCMSTIVTSANDNPLKYAVSSTATHSGGATANVTLQPCKGVTISPFRAFFYGFDVNGAPIMTTFDDGSGTTGIRSIDNGQLTIDNVFYDLSGRRVENPTKGIYIVNGKKVVIK